MIGLSRLIFRKSISLQFSISRFVFNFYRIVSICFPSETEKNRAIEAGGPMPPSV